MGGDGGSFAGRVDVVRTKGYKFMRNLGGMGYTPNQQVRETDERLSKNESRELQNSTCALSEEKLKPPLLVCRVGRLYNKEKVINAILQKTLPPHMKHVRSIKDMKDCNVETGATKSANGGGADDKAKPNITGTFTCPMCNNEHDAERDLIPLSPDEDEAASLLLKALDQRRVKKKSKSSTLESNNMEQGTPGTAALTTQAKIPEVNQGVDGKEEASIEQRVAIPRKRIRDWVLETSAGDTWDPPKTRKILTNT